MPKLIWLFDLHWDMDFGETGLNHWSGYTELLDYQECIWMRSTHIFSTFHGMMTTYYIKAFNSNVTVKLPHYS